MEQMIRPFNHFWAGAEGKHENESERDRFDPEVLMKHPGNYIKWNQGRIFQVRRVSL